MITKHPNPGYVSHFDIGEIITPLFTTGISAGNNYITQTQAQKTAAAQTQAANAQLAATQAAQAAQQQQLMQLLAVGNKTSSATPTGDNKNLIYAGIAVVVILVIVFMFKR